MLHWDEQDTTHTPKDNIELQHPIARNSLPAIPLTVVPRVDHYDPDWVGKRRRQLNIIFAALSILAAPVMIITKNLLKIGIGESYIFTMSILLGLYIAPSIAG